MSHIIPVIVSDLHSECCMKEDKLRFFIHKGQAIILSEDDGVLCQFVEVESS